MDFFKVLVMDFTRKSCPILESIGACHQSSKTFILNANTEIYIEFQELLFLGVRSYDMKRVQLQLKPFNI